MKAENAIAEIAQIINSHPADSRDVYGKIQVVLLKYHNQEGAQGDLRWTMRRPITDGFYWFRGRYIRSSERKTLLMEYHRVKSNTIENLMIPGVDRMFTVEDFEGEWAGPIPQPIE